MITDNLVTVITKKEPHLKELILLMAKEYLNWQLDMNLLLLSD